MPERFVHSSLGGQKGPIRLLHIQPSKDYHAPLEVDLEEVELSSEPDFKALSYVWGDPTDTIPILIYGKTYDITVNCHSALLRLRQIGEARLWIDAICINQRDDQEKMQQIQSMRDIYYSAREVIVWLGYSEPRPPSEEENDRVLFELLEDLQNLTDDSFPEKFEEVFFDGPGGFEAAEAFVTLLYHPWFTRLWVHQEICLAKHALALTRFRTFPMKKILDVRLDQVNGPRVFKRFGQSPQMLAGLLEKGVALGSRAMSVEKYDRKLKRVTGINDRVLGVLGLLDDDFVSQFNAATYRSLSNLFVATTRALVLENRSLYALTLVQKSSLRLPTWVVDWEQNSRGEKNYRYHYTSYNSDLHCPQAMLLCPPGSHELQIIGLSVDSVLSCTSEPLVHRDATNISSLISARKTCLDLWLKHFSHYPKAADAKEVTLRTLTADINYLDGIINSTTRLTNNTLLTCQTIFDSLEQKTSLPALVLSHLQTSPDLTDSERAYLFAMWNHLREMKFFVSSLGYMGTCPGTPQVGDTICVFPGSKMPLLLRRTGKKVDRYTLVGPCFVWGLMDGEGFGDREFSVLDGMSFEDVRGGDCWMGFEVV
ncbi:hypothetical protein HYFRA_00001344 [Hymenoscyphus fraxineus]|uniref:Heterokaryon incompatibility domain-containing protein n=1 Tax=Hymenoscyphus fraxineus TaxID=746836 RepID=A0A9N9L6I8_9HELO|nr:hypothetical protein HYFRA_00001344 [Hymenoscyphus fraxineus]